MLTFAITMGIVCGLARGGTLPTLAARPWRFIWLAGVAFALQAFAVWGVGANGPTPVASTLHVVSYLLLGIIVAANWRIPGMTIVGAGLLLNFLVIVANGGYMPITPEALMAHGEEQLAAVAPGGTVVGSKDIVLEHGQAQLWILSDVITTRLPFWQRSFSVGDVVLALGLFYLVQAGMRSRPHSATRTALKGI